MNIFNGEVNVNGSISYVPQQPWMQNETVKNNILFGNNYDESIYNKCIKACALETDLNLLPGGDNTEIGEKVILSFKME
jgi:ABC-type multidrug transport system fused ATPase/permease subunit